MSVKISSILNFIFALLVYILSISITISIMSVFKEQKNIFYNKSDDDDRA